MSSKTIIVFDEIVDVKKACGKTHLKVILEAGELETLDNVRKASEIAIYAGADFIKTSTGKIQPAATMQVTYVMLDAIKDYYVKITIITKFTFFFNFKFYTIEMKLLIRLDITLESWKIMFWTHK